MSLGALATTTVGCARSEAPLEAPLRPLLYTESNAGGPSAPPGFGEWVASSYDPVAYPSVYSTSSAHSVSSAEQAPRTPEELMIRVFDALLAQDEDALRSYLFTPEAYSASARTGSEAAVAAIAEMEAETLETFRLFDPGPASNARQGGLGSLLEAGQLVVGRGRNIDGGLVDEDEAPVMHWGNELTVDWPGTNVSFTLRYPKLLVDEAGVWRLAAAPEVDARFRAFRAAGLDLKPELMDTQHAGFPLSVGSYWHYRTRRPSVATDSEGVGEGVGDDDGPEGYGVLTHEGYRDEVIRVTEYAGYRLIRVRRLFDSPGRTSETLNYLVTPTRLYRCTRDCVYRAEDVQWMLDYVQTRVPLLVLPPEPGTGWGAGGTDGRNNVFRTQVERAEASVPAGVFGDAFEVVKNTANGRESTYFVPGIGVVMVRRTDGFTTEIEELIDYRVMH